ncbi:hypothetical protein L1887_23155 [Cichorium endivia]|nr:hypothetical protein L1887_23155 [Cichorium endivia]
MLLEPSGVQAKGKKTSGAMSRKNTDMRPIQLSKKPVAWPHSRDQTGAKWMDAPRVPVQRSAEGSSRLNSSNSKAALVSNSLHISGTKLTFSVLMVSPGRSHGSDCSRGDSVQYTLNLRDSLPLGSGLPSLAADRSFSCTGYGHEEAGGREALDQAFVEIFGAESIIVRSQRLAVAGAPYDTLEEVIGMRDENGLGSLKDFGIKYREVALADDGGLDWDALEVAIKPPLLITLKKGDHGEFRNPAKKSEDVLLYRTQNGLIFREFPVKETHKVVRPEDENGNKMANEYVGEYKIGSGSYGKVVLYRSQIDRKHYAIKAFHKSHPLKLRVAPSEPP